jgi:hypothetical protein
MHTSPKAWLIESIVPVQLPVPLLYVMREPGSMQPFHPGLHVLLSQNNTSGYKMGCLQQQLPRIGVWFGRSKHGHTTQLADNVPTWARRGCARVNLSFSQVDAAWVSDAAARLCNALLGWAPGWPAAQVDEPTRPAQGTAPVTCHATALVYNYSAYTVPPSLTTLRQPSAYTC